MNTTRDIYSRVLKLFPVSEVKEHFDKKNKSQQSLISEIVASKSIPEIREFVNKFLPHTKQHLYVYEFERPKNFKLDLYPQAYECGQTAIQGYTIYNFLLPITSTVIEVDMMRKSTLNNFWPISVWIGNKNVIISLTILERLLSYFEESQDVRVIGQDVTEEQVIKDIQLAFSKAGTQLVSADLTKGIKGLMRKKILGLSKVQFKKAKSVSQETMDENFALEDEMPEVFEDIMLKPLERGVFRFRSALKEIDDMPTSFASLPPVGFIAIPRYSPKIDSIAKTVNLILSNN